MNLLQKAIYVLACDVPAFIVWCAYSILVHGSVSWGGIIATSIALLASIAQLIRIKNSMERISVRIDEMTMRGANPLDIISTVITYLFLFSFLIPTAKQTQLTDEIIMAASLGIQLLLDLLTDNAPYDLVYFFAGYTYRVIKIDGTEYTLLCRKKLRNKTSIRCVVNPFQSFLIHIEQR